MNEKYLIVNGAKYIREDLIGNEYVNKRWNRSHNSSLNIDIDKFINDFYEENKKGFDNSEIGKLTNEFLMVRDDVFKAKTNEMNIDESSFLKYLKAEGRLIISSSKRYKHCRRVKGVSRYYVKISLK